MDRSSPLIIVKGVLCVVLVSFLSFQVPLNLGGFDGDSSKDTRIAVAGEKYKASGFHKWFLGKDYRDLWAMPIEVSLLNLQRFAGGLEPQFRFGRKQTLGLALKGADGRSYSFRGLDKDPTTLLPPSFAETLAARILQDQTVASHPAGAVIVPLLAEAAEVLHTEPRLVLMPDDPGLKEFQNDFAGVLGTIEEYPTAASDAHSGTFGATEIISSAEMWKRMLANPETRVDSEAFLRARLLDILIGDWDRHSSQWRWAKTPEDPQWQPIPEDRDQAFSRYEGIVLSWVRMRHPELLKFRASYPGLEGMILVGAEVDRKVLTGLERSAWTDVSSRVQERLTDAVIDEAVRRMPQEYYELNGEMLARQLKNRRDKLLDVAEDYYKLLAAEVDVHCTDQADFVKIECNPDGDLLVNVSLDTQGETPAETYYSRKFVRDETNEVRIYLHAGNDRVISEGQAKRRILVRVIGEEGSNVVDDSKGGKIHFYGSPTNNRLIEGYDSEFESRPHKRPEQNPENPLREPRDWGRRTSPQLWPGFSTDIGLFLGGGILTTRYGFRKIPYASRHLFRAGYATIARTGRFEYEGSFPRENSSLYRMLSARVSGIEILRFYGIGNETSSDESEDFYKIRQAMISLFPAARYLFSPQLEVYGGPEIKFSFLKDDPNTLLGQLRPYGVGDFGQFGLRLGMRYDSRDPSRATSPGFRLRAEGFLYPHAWNVYRVFGGIEGDVAGYLPVFGRVVFALRGGGKKVYGTYPYQEAAYLGGKSTIRGFARDRFAGDASLYGNAELRLTLGKAVLVLPGEVGVFGLADMGRVFVRGESSNKWHSSYGGGLFFSVLDLSTIFSITVATCEERTSVYFMAGFWF